MSKTNRIPPHLTDRTFYSLQYNSPTLYRALKNSKCKFYRLKTLTLYLCSSFCVVSYGCQLQQDNFLTQHFNPNPSSKTTKECKSLPESWGFFPLQLFSLKVMDFSLLFEDICVKLPTKQ